MSSSRVCLDATCVRDKRGMREQKFTTKYSPKAAVWVHDEPTIAEDVTRNFLVDFVARVEVPFRVWVITRNYDKREEMRNEFIIVGNTFLYDIGAGFERKSRLFIYL